MKHFLCAALLVFPLLCNAQGATINTAEPQAANANPESNLARVRDKLKLNDAQQVLWLAYVARIDDLNKVFYEERPVSALSGNGAPKQIEKYIDHMQNRLAVLDDIERSTKALYAVLNADQKQIADQMLFSTIPVFASSANASCPESTPKNQKPDTGQRKRRSGAMGGSGAVSELVS